jgi:hypothetical protein
MDVTQETFVVAWQQLTHMRVPAVATMAVAAPRRRP